MPDKLLIILTANALEILYHLYVKKVFRDKSDIHLYLLQK